MRRREFLNPREFRLGGVHTDVSSFPVLHDRLRCQTEADCTA